MNPRLREWIVFYSSASILCLPISTATVTQWDKDPSVFVMDRKKEHAASLNWTNKWGMEDVENYYRTDGLILPWLDKGQYIECLLRRNSFGKFVSTKRVHLSLSCFICTQKHDWQMSRCLLRWSNELSEGVLFFRSFVYTQKWHEWQISLSVAMTKVELLWSPGKTKCTKVLWS